MTTMRQYLMIGGGVASIAAAEAIRRQDPQGRLTLVSDDPFGYYSRPGLAYYLTGELNEDQLYPYQPPDFRSLNLNRVRGRVAAIDAAEHRVRLADGRSLSYDRLLVAVGAKAAHLDLPGVDLEGVVKLDSLEDARHILKLARKARKAVVVGGGITALELVEGLAARAIKVSYFLRGDRYWKNVLDETESRIVEHRLKEDGVQLHYHTELESIEGRRGRVSGVRTQDGRTFDCQLVAVAIGIRPRLSLAQSAGLQTERGILVDELMRTSATDIFAAGDVAQVFDPRSGKSVLDSLWGPAREQGTAAGLNMAGCQQSYLKPVAFNVTRLAGLTTTIIGTVGRGADRDLHGIARGDSETWRELPDAIAAQADFDVNRLRVLVGEKHLIGAIVMGDQTLSQPLQHLVAQRIDISPIRSQLLAVDAPIADLVADFWGEVRRQHA